MCYGTPTGACRRRSSYCDHPTNAKQRFTLPKKKAIKRHEATEEADDQSDSEGEYNSKDVVYDSDSEPDEDFIDEDNLSEDKKKVLHFFNEGTEQELACIQGCSKKKVKDIAELRPYEGWGDLVSGNKETLVMTD